MNAAAVTVGAVAVGGAALVLDAAAPKGAEVGHSFEPPWSRTLRREVTRAFDLDPRPGEAFGSVPQAVLVQFQRLAEQHGTITIAGDKIANITVRKVGEVASWWAALLVRTGVAGVTEGSGWYADAANFVGTAARVPAAQTFVDQTAVMYTNIARFASADAYDPALTKQLRHDLAVLATELDDPNDSFVPANPDDRTYWDFLYARAKDSTPLKIAYAPFYVPYKVMEAAWDHIPGIAGIAKDLLGPAAKMIVTTFGVVIFVGGVGLYVYKKWPGPKVTVG
jgi:hypothetical protein